MLRTKSQPNSTLKMARPKSELKLRSSSESQIAGMIAKMFGVMPTDELPRVFDQIADVHGRELPDLRGDFQLYPWECPLAAYVMSDKVNTLAEDLAGSNGAPFVVKDSVGSGRSGLWVVRASFDAAGAMPPDLPVRALINHFLIGDEWMRIIAYQLETCLRKLKTNTTL